MDETSTKDRARCHQGVAWSSRSTAVDHNPSATIGHSIRRLACDIRSISVWQDGLDNGRVRPPANRQEVVLEVLLVLLITEHLEVTLYFLLLPLLVAVMVVEVLAVELFQIMVVMVALMVQAVVVVAVLLAVVEL